MSITLNGDTGILVPANAEIEVGTNNGLSSPAANKIAINTNGTQRLIVDDSGNIGVGTGTPAMSLDVSGQVRASSGILFGTDTAAANTLDDYEEGTWTPIIGGTTSESGQTYDLQSGSYTKIGDRVYCGFDVRLSAKGTISGFVAIKNLPFAANNRFTGDGSIGLFQNLGSNVVFFGITTPTENLTVAELSFLSSASSLGSRVSDSLITNTTRLIGGLSYRV